MYLTVQLYETYDILTNISDNSDYCFLFINYLKSIDINIFKFIRNKHIIFCLF